MDVVEYDVTKDLKLVKPGKFRYRMKIGTVPQGKNSQKSFIWLSKAILSRAYFLKIQHPLVEDYTFTSLRYMVKNDKRFKAVDTLQDIKDLLGKIDSEADLHLWLYASENPWVEAYSYKKVGKLYRVRFRTAPGSLGCNYMEEFRYYNSDGERVKNKKIKTFTIKDCGEILI